MKRFKIASLGIGFFLLMACGRSSESYFYSLDPLPFPMEKRHSYSFRHLKIGIDAVKIPGYVERPQLMIRYTPYRFKLEEHHEWAEALNDNMMRTIKINISSLLPGALVEGFPWDEKFKPNYHLRINLLAFDMTVLGDSFLRAEYLIYHKDKLLIRKTVCFHRRAAQPSIEKLIAHSNANLLDLTRDIASLFAKI